MRRAHLFPARDPAFSPRALTIRRFLDFVHFVADNHCGSTKLVCNQPERLLMQITFSRFFTPTPSFQNMGAGERGGGGGVRWGLHHFITFQNNTISGCRLPVMESTHHKRGSLWRVKRESAKIFLPPPILYPFCCAGLGCSPSATVFTPISPGNCNLRNISSKRRQPWAGPWLFKSALHLETLWKAD